MNDTEVRRLIADFLEANQEGRLDDAAAMCADGAIFEFPYGTFDDLHDRKAAATAQYRTIRKRHDLWDVHREGDRTVVVTAGTLYGEDLEGRRFEDVRFLDRFEVSNGRIVRQQVYNDLAWAGVTTPRHA